MDINARAHNTKQPERGAARQGQIVVEVFKLDTLKFHVRMGSMPDVMRDAEGISTVL
jgi:hypothetical protein